MRPSRSVGDALLGAPLRLYYWSYAGKTVVDAQMLGVDMLTIVGHKFGAPKGIAALFVKGDVE